MTCTIQHAKHRGFMVMQHTVREGREVIRICYISDVLPAKVPGLAAMTCRRIVVWLACQRCRMQDASWHIVFSLQLSQSIGSVRSTLPELRAVKILLETARSS